jgi:DHA2 family multidrug resistance protein-like MFS transporter
LFGIKSIATDGLGGIGVQAILFGVFCAIWFVRRQLRSESPMLDVRLFTKGSFGGAVLVNLFSVIALVGFLYFVSQHLQLIAGLSPVSAGLALLPGLVAMIVAGLVVVPIARKHSTIGSLFATQNAYPREALTEAVLRFVEEDLAARGK